MKPQSLLESLKRLVPELPRILPAGSTPPLHFSSSGSGGGGNYDDPDDYYDDLPDDQPETARREARDDPQATAARRRTVQSEPDDRYWTDYLRIALPVIGLLLVIAVFWYWAQQLIDDDGGEINATEPAGIAEVVETATAEPTQESTPVDTASGTQQGGEVAAPPTSAQDSSPEQQAQPSPTPSPEPEQETDSGITDEELAAALQETTGGGSGEIEADMAVVVTEDGDQLSLRSDPTTSEQNVIANLPSGTELDVVSGPEEAEGYTWWQVVTPTGDQGWVVEGNDELNFIEPAE